MKESNLTWRQSLTELRVIRATANSQLSHPDVSQSLTEGHYKGIKMGNHKRLEPKLL
jgi:hypothetical protein